jgi:molybdate transport system regulatory protein
MNRIEVTITRVLNSGGIIMVDMEAGGLTMTALLIDTPHNPSWLIKGNMVYAIFKETEVSIAKDFSGKISLRNKLPCRVRKVERGELMSIIHMTFHDYNIQSAITTRSVEMLDLRLDDEVTAMIKANEITLMQKI